MAFSWQESTVASGTQNITCDIEYLDKSYIHVYLNGQETTGFSWVSDTVIRLNTALTEQTTVLLVRRTEREYLYVQFASGAPFLEANVDTQNKQLLHLAQELVEGRAIEGFYGAISMNRYRITNLGSPVNATDAANKSYVDTQIQAESLSLESKVAARLSKTVRSYKDLNPISGNYAGKLLAFDSSGQPYGVTASTGSAQELAQELASPDAGKGASLVSLEGGGTVQELADNLTIKHRYNTLNYSEQELVVGTDTPFSLSVSSGGVLRVDSATEDTPLNTVPYVHEVGAVSKIDGTPVRELVVPVNGAEDYASSPKLSFIAGPNRKVEVWAIHPDAGRNVWHYQDLLGSPGASGVTKSKHQRFRYKLLDIDDRLESVQIMRYAPRARANIYGQYIDHVSTGGYSRFNFYLYFGAGSPSSMGVNREPNLFDKVAEPASKKYLNTYLLLKANSKWAVYPIEFVATTVGDSQLVLRVHMDKEPDGTVLTAGSAYTSGYYGQAGATAVTYEAVELITTTDTLVTGAGLSTPYTIANSQYAYLNAVGRVYYVVDQSVTSKPTTVIQTVVGVSQDASTKDITVTTADLNYPNLNVGEGLCTYHARMSAIKDRLRSTYYRTTSLLDVLGDYASGYDLVHYLGQAQLFADHENREEEYING